MDLKIKDRKKTSAKNSITVFKVLCIGTKGVGKKSLINRYTVGIYEESAGVSSFAEANEVLTIDSPKTSPAPVGFLSLLDESDTLSATTTTTSSTNSNSPTGQGAPVGFLSLLSSSSSNSEETSQTGAPMGFLSMIEGGGGGGNKRSTSNSSINNCNSDEIYTPITPGTPQGFLTVDMYQYIEENTPIDPGVGLNGPMGFLSMIDSSSSDSEKGGNPVGFLSILEEEDKRQKFMSSSAKWSTPKPKNLSPTSSDEAGTNPMTRAKTTSALFQLSTHRPDKSIGKKKKIRISEESDEDSDANSDAKSEKASRASRYTKSDNGSGSILMIGNRNSTISPFNTPKTRASRPIRSENIVESNSRDNLRGPSSGSLSQSTPRSPSNKNLASFMDWKRTDGSKYERTIMVSDSPCSFEFHFYSDFQSPDNQNARESIIISHGFIFFFDITKRKTFNNIEKNLRFFFNNRVPSQHSVILVGSMYDKAEKREVSFREADGLSKKYNIPYFECSSKTNYGLEYAFQSLLSGIEFEFLIYPKFELLKYEFKESLSQAIISHSIQKIRYLIGTGKSPDVIGKGGWAPIHVACWEGLVDVVFLLIQACPNCVNSVSRDGWTPLHFAARRGYDNLVSLLADSGADVCARDLNKKLCTDTRYRRVRDALTKYYEAKRRNLSLQFMLDFEKFIELSTTVIDFDIGYANLQSFPLSISKLTQLTRLSLISNNITELPSHISALKNLKILLLSYNQIAVIPSEIAMLRNLEHLDFRNNKLTSIASNIGDIPSLKILLLSHNLLAYLPYQLEKLESTLDIFDIYNNPLTTIPADIIPKIGELHPSEVHHLFAYLRNIGESGEEEYNRVKMMFVGDGNVGKTSLLNCFIESNSKKSRSFLTKSKLLKHGEYKEPTETIATDGIDISEVSYTLPSGKEVIWDCWDYAGQEIYYTTHQFFLSRRSIYLIVFSLLDKNISRVEYWINSIHTRARGSPMILVGTHADHKDCTKEYIANFIDNIVKNIKPERFKSKLGVKSIKGIVTVSSKKRTGVRELLELISEVVTKSKFIGQVFPSTWLKLENTLAGIRLNGNSPCINWEEFNDIATSCSITGKSAKEAVKFLHRIGVLCYFDDEKSGLNNLVIIDPQFLTNVMSSVITLKHRFGKDTKNEGIIFEYQLPQIWKDYPPSLRKLLVNLLEKFEISFFLPDEGEEETTISYETDSGRNRKMVVPSLLSEQQPSLKDHWDIVKGKRINGYLVGRNYQFAFLPLGFFTRLFVRNFHLPDTKVLIYWRNGMLMQRNTSKALIRYNPSRYQLSLEVYNGVSDESTDQFYDMTSFLRLLVGNIETTIEGWYETHITVTVPCSHCLREGDYNPHIFTLDECVTAIHECVGYVLCKRVRRVRIDIIAPDYAFMDMRNLLINYSDIKIIGSIGEGAFGSVYLGIYNKKTPEDENDTSIVVVENENKTPRSARSKSNTISNSIKNSSIIPVGTTDDNDNNNNNNSNPNLSKKGDQGDTSKSDNDHASKVAIKLLTITESDKSNEANDMSFTNVKNSVDEHKNQKLIAKFTEFQREVWIMSCLNHSNLCSLVGISNNPMAMIMEFVPLGDLYHLLSSCKEYVDTSHTKKQRTKEKKSRSRRPSLEFLKLLDFKVKLKLMHNIALGIRHLHQLSPPIIHRDLRSPNIFISNLDYKSYEAAKVGDFGLSRLNSSSLAGGEFNLNWLAPEVMSGKDYNEKIDVYSFAIIMWEILTLHKPFEEYDDRFAGKPKSVFRDAVLSGLRPSISSFDEYCQYLSAITKRSTNNNNNNHNDEKEINDDEDDVIAENDMKIYQQITTLITECWADEPNQRPNFDLIVTQLSSILSENGIPFRNEDVGGVAQSRNNYDISDSLSVPNSREVLSLHLRWQVNEDINKIVVVPDRNYDKICVVCVGKLLVYNMQYQKEDEIRVCDEKIYDLIVSKPMTVWASTELGIIYVFSLKEHKRLHSFDEHSGKLIRSLLFIESDKEKVGKKGDKSSSKGGIVWSADIDGNIFVWRADSKPKIKSKFKVGRPVTVMVNMKNFVCVGTDGPILLVNKNTLATEMKLEGHSHMISSLLFYKQNLWSSSYDGTVAIWDIDKGSQVIQPLQAHTSKVLSLASFGEYVFSSSFDMSVIVWDPLKYELIQEIKLHSEAVRYVHVINNKLWTGSLANRDGKGELIIFKVNK